MFKVTMSSVSGLLKYDNAALMSCWPDTACCWLSQVLMMPEVVVLKQLG
jgi:hypothetical protein